MLRACVEQQPGMLPVLPSAEKLGKHSSMQAVQIARKGL
jgi:hypothetical protein